MDAETMKQLTEIWTQLRDTFSKAMVQIVKELRPVLRLLTHQRSYSRWRETQALWMLEHPGYKRYRSRRTKHMGQRAQ